MTNSILCDYFSSSYLKCHSVNLKNDNEYKMIRGLLKGDEMTCKGDTGLTLKIGENTWNEREVVVHH